MAGKFADNSMTNPAQHTWDVFVSYADADSAWVKGYLFDALSCAGIRYYSEDTLPSQPRRIAEIERAITHSKYTLLILSSAYLADNLTQFTNLVAQHFELETSIRSVIPIILDDTPLPIRFKMLVTLDAREPANWEQVIQQLVTVLHVDPPRISFKPPCPYPGMVPFEEEDSIRFFGRETVIEEMLHRLQNYPALAVVGASGSGKSSLINAGLIPALRQKRSGYAGNWLVHKMRPGDQPISLLSERLGALDNPKQAIATQMDAHPNVRQLLLVIDQFEELFIVGGTQTQVFQNKLKQFIAIPNFYLVLTVRADYYQDLMNSPLWSEIEDHLMNIRPLGAESLRAAIAKPAEYFPEDQRGFVAPALIERLVADAGDEPGILPFVQETMVLLWERLYRRFLPLNLYDELAASMPTKQNEENIPRTGLQVAMAIRADNVYGSLTPAQQTIARRIFIRLVQFGEGRKDARRQQPVDTLRSTNEVPSTFDETLQHLVHHRLLTLSSDPVRHEIKVDLAHEALITGWNRLARWVKEQKENEEMRRRLETKAAEWIRLGNGEGGLLDATEMREASQWLKSNPARDLGYNPSVLELIQASAKAINPGWNRPGTAGLLIDVIAIGALVGLLYFFLQTTNLPNSTMLAIFVFVFMIAFVLVIVLLILRRSDRHVLERFSHTIATQRSMSIFAAVIPVSAIILWAGFGLQLSATEQACKELGYYRESQASIAVINQTADDLGADLFRATLKSASNGSLVAWTTTPENARRCGNFFRHVIMLRHVKTPGNNESAYIADISSAVNSTNIETEQVISSDRCSLYGMLSYKVVKKLGFSTAALYEQDIVGPPNCEPYLANEEGAELLGEKKYADAEVQFRRAIQLFPDYATAHANLGIALYESGKSSQAIPELVRAVELSKSTHIPFLSHLAIACYRADDLACAEKYNNRVVQLDPTNVVALNNLSIIYRELKQYDRADQSLRQAEKLLSDRTDQLGNQYAVTKNRGILEFKRGNLPDARQSLEKANRMGQSFKEEITYYLIRISEQAGQLTQACTYWQEYLQIKPSGLYKEAERRADAEKRMSNACQRK